MRGMEMEREVGLGKRDGREEVWDGDRDKERGHNQVWGGERERETERDREIERER